MIALRPVASSWQNTTCSWGAPKTFVTLWLLSERTLLDAVVAALSVVPGTRPRVGMSVDRTTGDRRREHESDTVSVGVPPPAPQ
ncbi:hypothetical protein GCM10023191_006720 [Actinoallomurus oryzae]|uniref:Uncharacterized protein n=1 Tax=Actinoallomurus oryzae TaxID=502180 RepID=A0ABP8PCE3_9ACTN